MYLGYSLWAQIGPHSSFPTSNAGISVFSHPLTLYSLFRHGRTQSPPLGPGCSFPSRHPPSSSSFYHYLHGEPLPHPKQGLQEDSAAMSLEMGDRRQMPTSEEQIFSILASIGFSKFLVMMESHASCIFKPSMIFGFHRRWEQGVHPGRRYAVWQRNKSCRTARDFLEFHHHGPPQL